jgi:cholesterol oxidase
MPHSRIRAVGATTPSMATIVRSYDGAVVLNISIDLERGVSARAVFIPVNSIDPSSSNFGWGIDLEGIYLDTAKYRVFSSTNRRGPYNASPDPEPFSASEWLKVCGGVNPYCPIMIVLLDETNLASGAPAAPVPGELRVINSILKSSTDVLSRGIVCLPPPRMPGKDTFSFILSSCLYPGGILDRSLEVDSSSPPGPADASLIRLADSIRKRRLKDQQAPSFLLNVGDFVYVDPEAGLMDVRNQDERTAGAYRALLSSRGAQAALGLIPLIASMDDHEIENNWEPASGSNKTFEAKRLQDALDAGVEAFYLYQRAKPPNRSTFEEHSGFGVDLFLADTRTKRTSRTVLQSPLSASLLGSEQEKALFAWIAIKGDAKGEPIFIASPSMVLPRSRRIAASPLETAIHCDSWCGYPASLYGLLATLHQHNASNVVLLSGDEHQSSITKIDIADAKGSTVTVYSVHSSGLYAPFGFANSRPRDFVSEDCFTFDHGSAHYSIKVSVLEWVEGDGYVEIECSKKDGRWTIKASFNRRQGEIPVSFDLS